MNQKELKELIEFLIEKDIAEFELERGDVKVRIKRAGDSSASTAGHEARYIAVHTGPPPAAVTASAPAAAPTDAPPKESAPVAEEVLHMVRSPIVGTFYESPSPGSPPFVKPGDVVEIGQVLCIVEAMKLMNEIESDVEGVVTRIYPQNGQPIEYGEKLFAVKLSS